jgi:hypothetical protein
MEDAELTEVPAIIRKRALTIAEILRGSEYSLTLFSAEEVAALELFERNDKPYTLAWLLQSLAQQSRRKS